MDISKRKSEAMEDLESLKRDIIRLNKLVEYVESNIDKVLTEEDVKEFDNGVNEIYDSLEIVYL